MAYLFMFQNLTASTIQSTDVRFNLFYLWHKNLIYWNYKTSHILELFIFHHLIFIKVRIRWGQNTDSESCQNSDHFVNTESWKGICSCS